MTTLDIFTRSIARVTAAIAGLSLDAALEARLNAEFPGGGEFFRETRRACEEAIKAGWMCQQGEGARRFGRIVQPGSATHGFSIDVVDITDLVGPHHRHPTGEIDMIMPLTPAACFDGRGEGWLVYPPNSAHRPTVSAGRALILYLLPKGEIEFTAT
ncbi:MAG: DUF4863 family protein [Proteobacteria bacterium]|nr:DUF4863 family protein [Pseudomonadota bacterium]